MGAGKKSLWRIIKQPDITRSEPDGLFGQNCPRFGGWNATIGLTVQNRALLKGEVPSIIIPRHLSHFTVAGAEYARVVVRVGQKLSEHSRVDPVHPGPPLPPWRKPSIHPTMKRRRPLVPRALVALSV